MNVAMGDLKNVDIIDVARKFERNEATGMYLYTVLRTAADIFGSKYVTNLGREMAANPQNPRFGLRANRVMVARYCMLFIGRLYQTTEDLEFLNYIGGFLMDGDERIRNEARGKLRKIGTPEALRLLDDIQSDLD